jgi:putative flippase GtrA
MVVFIKYFASGMTAVGVHFLVMIVLVELFSTPPPIGSFSGFCAGSIVNYYLQYSWTFRSNQSHRLAFIRYTTITLVMLLLNLLVFQLAWKQIGVDYRIAQILATGIVFMANFVINSHYTFK